MIVAAPARKVRVLIVARWPVGGIRSYLRYTYGLLSPAVFELVLVGPQSAEIEECRNALGDFQPPIYPAKSSAMPHMLRATLSALRNERLDIVHSQGYSSALAVALPVRLRGLPHVVTIHDMFTDALRRRLSVRLGRLALATALGMVDVIQPTGAAVEANFRTHMNIWPATRPRIRTLRNGIDAKRFAGDERRDLRAELQLSPNDFLIGFLGRFMAIKGFHVLVGAIEKLVAELNPPRRPVVIAVGSGGFIREDQAFIERKRLSDHFRFLPHTNQVAQTLRGLDVVAIPSFSEASPILPMEALSCGVPVIASDAPGLLDVLKDSPARLFPIGDSTQLARALLAAISEDNTQDSKVFRAVAMDRFDALRTARQIEAMLLELAGAEPRTVPAAQ
jgi:glycosyltransferase involved in cell wall biosynthesis